MKRIKLLLACVCSAFALAGCAPITPLPGGIPAPIPQPPSAGGAPSMPGGTPPSLPGGSPSLPGGQPGGQPGGEQGGQPGGQPSSDSSGGLPGGGMPGGQPSGMPGSNDANDSPDGQSSEPTWDVEQGGAAGGEGSEAGGSVGGAGAQGSGDDGWETSNEIPGTPGSADDDSGNGTDGPAGAAADENGGTPTGDDELDGALKDFDGEILAEREIISSSQTGNPEGGGALELPTSSEGQGNGGDVADTSSPLPQRRQIPSAPPPPPRGSESGPENLPDARDDDIIARQLREAAMQESDPELKEKLWDEYRKYKKG